MSDEAKPSPRTVSSTETVSSTVSDGFWLPRGIREKLISPATVYESRSYRLGRPCQENDPQGVTARWPQLQPEGWQMLLAALRQNRMQAPTGEEFWQRLQAALKQASQCFSVASDPLRLQALGAIPGYTGYSEAMIRFTLGALDLMSLDQMPAVFTFLPKENTGRDWQPMPGLPGRLRFYPEDRWLRVLSGLPGLGNRPLFSPPARPELVVGYGAGNVPGTALIIAFLALATTLSGSLLPVVVIKNSRREPIFSSLMLTALEQADPALVSTLAVLAWDYEDAAVQNFLLPQADLVIAAASDETITQIQSQIKRSSLPEISAADQASPSQTSKIPGTRYHTRLHSHGHKVSFSAIGKETLAHGLADPATGQPLLDIVTLLAALDSIFWDQHGCLSSRFHFVEIGGVGCHSPLEYTSRLEAQLRLLASFLPRGAWPLQPIHDRFDRYKQLETTGQVQVFSNYDDEFLVVLDQRPLDASAFFSLVNECQGRVIIVRPVSDLMEIPQYYLRLLPARNLQSLSMAVGQPGTGLSERFLRFATACGERGITAIRTVGRGAFPQLSYSWDGLIPLDLLCSRPAGHFTTIEFDSPFEEILNTYHNFTVKAASPRTSKPIA